MPQNNPTRRTSEYWRLKAENARVLAQDMSDRGGRGTIERIAELYEDMAAAAERREKAGKPSQATRP